MPSNQASAATTGTTTTTPWVGERDWTQNRAVRKTRMTTRVTTNASTSVSSNASWRTAVVVAVLLVTALVGAGETDDDGFAVCRDPRRVAAGIRPGTGRRCRLTCLSLREGVIYLS
ncbi:MAG: hypothetical protein V5A55_04340 [Halovenus sp.]